MSSLEFCYWLKGYFEINNNISDILETDQVNIIKDHLDLVFTKVTPDRRAGNQANVDKYQTVTANIPKVPGVWFNDLNSVSC